MLNSREWQVSSNSKKEVFSKWLSGHSPIHHLRCMFYLQITIVTCENSLLAFNKARPLTVDLLSFWQTSVTEGLTQGMCAYRTLGWIEIVKQTGYLCLLMFVQEEFKYSLKLLWLHQYLYKMYVLSHLYWSVVYSSCLFVCCVFVRIMKNVSWMVRAVFVFVMQSMIILMFHCFQNLCHNNNREVLPVLWSLLLLLVPIIFVCKLQESKPQPRRKK